MVCLGKRCANHGVDRGELSRAVRIESRIYSLRIIDDFRPCPAWFPRVAHRVASPTCEQGTVDSTCTTLVLIRHSSGQPQAFPRITPTDDKRLHRPVRIRTPVADYAPRGGPQLSLFDSRFWALPGPGPTTSGHLTDLSRAPNWFRTHRRPRGANRPKSASNRTLFSGDKCTTGEFVRNIDSGNKVCGGC